MQLDQIFNSGFINDNLQAKNKTEVLQELVKTVIDGGLKLDAAAVMEVLQQREKLGSTGIGDGVAIPHGKIPELEELVVAFGRSKEGISFDAIDGKPVNLFFLLLAPENSAGQHLKALAKISKMLKVVNFRKKLMDAKSRGDLYKAIIAQDQTCQL
ncbi:MAG TPA: PTS sugar transporter subunit IIA [Smithellaceae bacterium]|nr:PTS sugar transporter subunit IIA [Smithellaceae bacterium]HRS89639.1 PTS sugar transporter subunit IIA [Smithellaceae bacterium]HRV25805.1 PTS sugar transporter subunit IIA [Smithellaceae bacterium]